jgi:cephalosporin hydroxylase
MITFEEKSTTLKVDGKEIDLYSEESFKYISDLWLKVGWANKYCYRFTWLGMPILQLPEDMLKIQELIFMVKPKCIIETGVALGGSLIYYASILKTMGINGQVIGVELSIKNEDKRAILEHPMGKNISVIQGDSISPAVIDQVKSILTVNEPTLVILDSNHTKDHVLSELNLYSSFVSIGSYIVATDGIIKELANLQESPSLLKKRPCGIDKDYIWNNPQEAVKVFLTENNDFELESVPRLFNDSLRRVK